jgi:hypothetical protein
LSDNPKVHRRACRTLRAPLGVLLLLPMLGLLSRPAAACDSTCCLLLTRGQAGVLRKGGFQLEFSFRSTDMSARFQGGDSTDTVIRPKVLLETGEIIPGYHEDLEGTDSFLQLDAAWGVAASTTLFVSMPLITHREYLIGHGGVQTRYDLRGIGDLVVGARYALVRGGQRSLVGALGFQIPTGKNDIIDVYDSTILDPTMQPGTGSGDVIATLLWSTVAPGRSELGLSASYQINTKNSYDYAFGNQWIGAATLSRPIGSVVPSLQIKLVQQAHSWLVDSAVPSTGTATVYANAGLRYRSAQGISLYAHLLLPIYRHVNDEQLAPRHSLLIGLSKTF